MHTNTKYIFSEGQHRALNAKFNTVGGNPAPAQGMTLADVAMRAARQIGLVRSEFLELTEEGMTPQNSTLVRDGVADVIVTIDGLFHRLGLAYPLDIHNPVHFPLIPETDITAEVEGALTSTYIGLNAIEALVRQLEIYELAESRGERLQAPASLIVQQINVWANCILLSMHAIAYALHFDLIVDQQTVFASNMSKFTQDPEVAERGVAKYAALEVPAAVFSIEADGETFYVVKCTAEGPIKGTDGGDYSPGKILKGVDFHKPQWTPLTEAGERRFGILFGQIEPVPYNPEIAAREAAEVEARQNAYGGGWALDDNRDLAYVEVAFEIEGKERSVRFYNVSEQISGRVNTDEEFSVGPISKYTVGDYILLPAGETLVEVQLLKTYRHFPEPTPAEEVDELPDNYIELVFDTTQETDTWKITDPNLLIKAREPLAVDIWGDVKLLPASEIRVGMSVGVAIGPLDAVRFATVENILIVGEGLKVEENSTSGE